MRSMNEEPDGSVIGYMCAVDWECEIGAALGGNVVCSSVDDLKRVRPCCESCGIVEVRVLFSRVISEGSLEGEV